MKVIALVQDMCCLAFGVSITVCLEFPGGRVLVEYCQAISRGYVRGITGVGRVAKTAGPVRYLTSAKKVIFHTWSHFSIFEHVDDVDVDMAVSRLKSRLRIRCRSLFSQRLGTIGEGGRRKTTVEGR